MANPKAMTTTYRVDSESSALLHEMAAKCGFTRTRGKGAQQGQGNASALLRALATAYAKEPERIVSLLGTHLVQV